MSDSTGRTAMIAVIAGVVFAAFLALTPRLTASQTAEPDVAAIVTTTVPTPTQREISEPVVAVSGLDAFDGFDADPVEEEVVPEEWADEPADEGESDKPAPIIDGSLTMTVELLGPREGKEVVIIEDGDTVQWSLRVTNTGTEKLYGVYAFLEGAGHAPCDTTRLTPGSTTQCGVTGEVWYGEHTAFAWATAWTTEIQVATEISYDFSVG
jgi:hypothetical protein